MVKTVPVMTQPPGTRFAKVNAWNCQTRLPLPRAPDPGIFGSAGINLDRMDVVRVRKKEAGHSIACSHVVDGVTWDARTRVLYVLRYWA
jgi:hypothetical protein